MSLVQSLNEGGHPAPEDLRQDKRTNLFLAAVIESADCSSPVRLRNMSSSGALVQGAALPDPDTFLNLKRGSLEIAAHVVWSRPGWCGIKFAGVANVSDWLSEKTSVSGSQAQQRVDEIQAQARAGALKILPSPVRDTDLPREILNHRAAEEIMEVQRVLQMLGDELSNNPDVLIAHGESLQQFDIMSQILGHIAKVLDSSNPGQAAKNIGMESLRARLLR